ncbi:protein DELAY OF GERMINATION 1-like [Solanum pennellii]|uniref:Protein DELAY OF GERMINATION 1-like n=1 Tax=Solanum pennellii TaxID=28526 RepID=A0ABM1G359_SOLPN|nr:protein DELAY OF GERMINATION 1-like [Solanum pennellii]
MATDSKKTDREEQEYAKCAWMSLQHEELTELEDAAAQVQDGEKDEEKLTQLTEKIIQHFQEHSDNRLRLARKDVSPFFAPVTCSPLENSVLWIAGCRPSSFIRLIYALCGFEPDVQGTDPCLEGIVTEDLRELSEKQLRMINELQGKTIREERRIATKLASLQEDIVDQPLAGKMKKEGHGCEKADEALDEHSGHMADVIEEADRLRMKTLKAIVNILEPVQAVEYLAAAKKIRFCVQQWGEKRDQQHKE